VVSIVTIVICNSTVNNKNELNIVKIYDTSKTKHVIDKSKAFLLKKQS
jgi:hypothetical protein